MLSLKDHIPFRITLQTVLHTREDIPSFRRLLSTLERLGFWGIELNLPELNVIAPQELKSLLDQAHLRLTYLATGAYAQARKLSLSSADQSLRLAAVQGAAENIRYAAQLQAGIILGFFKGPPAPDEDRPTDQLRRSLSELCALSHWEVPVLLEATNHKETSVIHTLSSAQKMCCEVADPRLRILPDTYHMAIEESDMLQAVAARLTMIPNLHLSDDNRLFPGFGRLDFGNLLLGLKQMGYSGTLGIEGNLLGTLEEDLISTTEYLCREADRVHLIAAQRRPGSHT